MTARLEFLPADFKWYSFDTTSKAVTIPEALIDVGGGGLSKSRKLSDSSRMALALTDACCDFGCGKVFVLYPSSRELTKAQEALVEARAEFSQVPSLFYVPMTWSKAEQKRWRETMPIDRLVSLTSRYRMVPLMMSVLPIDVEFSPRLSMTPTLQGLKTGSVTILMTPVLYIAFTKAMTAQCTTAEETTLESKCAGGWAAFEAWRRDDGILGAAKKLSEMYRDPGADFVFFGSLIKRLIHANMTAAQHGQAYFERPRKRGEELDEQQGDIASEGAGGDDDDVAGSE